MPQSGHRQISPIKESPECEHRQSGQPNKWKQTKNCKYMKRGNRNGWWYILYKVEK